MVPSKNRASVYKRPDESGHGQFGIWWWHGAANIPTRSFTVTPVFAAVQRATSRLGLYISSGETPASTPTVFSLDYYDQVGTVAICRVKVLPLTQGCNDSTIHTANKEPCRLHLITPLTSLCLHQSSVRP